MKKIIICILLLTLVLISGCTKTEKIDIGNNLKIVGMDCDNNVLCYKNMDYIGLSCTHVESIKQCQELGLIDGEDKK